MLATFESAEAKEVALEHAAEAVRFVLLQIFDSVQTLLIRVDMLQSVWYVGGGGVR